MDAGGNRIVIRKTKPAHSKEQKVGLFLVLSIGFLAFLMGGFYIGAHLTSAFDIEYDGPPLLTLEQQQEQALIELQTSDSDGDGLTDYVELYVQRTSPYLSDTDGDGIDDATEISLGNDPNCAGELCDGNLGNETEVVPASPGLDGIDQPGLDVLDENLAVIDQLTTGVSAGDVRQFLIENGVEAELVNSYSDEELLQLYQEVIGGLDESGELDQIISGETE